MFLDKILEKKLKKVEKIKDPRVKPGDDRHSSLGMTFFSPEDDSLCSPGMTGYGDVIAYIFECLERKKMETEISMIM